MLRIFAPSRLTSLLRDPSYSSCLRGKHFPVTTNDSNITWHAGHVSREDREKLLGQKGVTVWMTGLSASGKSTIASIVEQMLLQKGKAAYRLDGDNIRFGLNKDPRLLREKCGYNDAAADRFGLSFSADDRAENIRRIGEVARLFVDAGVIAIA